MADLAGFTLAQLAPFTFEKSLPANASTDSLLLFVGHDNVHEALKYVLGGVQRSLKFTMFGYDDAELNDLIWSKIEDPNILVQVTLDLSQSAGVHEKKLLDADRTRDLAAFNSHVVIGQSETHRILHTKGFVADGIVLAEGSTNLSADGEGIFTQPDGPGGKGYHAQENTLAFMTCPHAINRFTARLDTAHAAAMAQAKRP